MYAQRYSVAITGSTSSAGTTAYTPVANGRLLSVRYSSGGTVSSTAVLTITNETTDETLYSKALSSLASITLRPRSTVVQSTGRTIYNTTGTTNPVLDYFEVANERLKCSISKSTASAQTGTLLIAIG